MRRLVRTGCAGCVALLVAAGAPAFPAARAQSAIEVQTIVSVPPPREEGGTAATAAVPPWDMPQWSPGVAPNSIAAADELAGPLPSVSTSAFTGAATPLHCRPGVYRAIIDERTELPLGTLCTLPDGTWQLLP